MAKKRPTPQFLRDHVGHEMKHLAFAAAEFRSREARRYHVALHDSALTRARAMLDFLHNQTADNKYTVNDYLEDRSATPPRCDLAGRWFGFISGRLAHVGTNREDTFDQWPDRAPGEDKGDDRLDRLTSFVIQLLRDRAKYVRPDCRSTLALMAQRAEEYLKDPTDERLEAMDPSHQ